MKQIFKKIVWMPPLTLLLALNIGMALPANTAMAAGQKPPPTCSGGGQCVDPAATAKCDKNRCDLVDKYVNPAISMLSVLFGLIAVISLIMGGIQYSASNGDPQKVSQAKDRITKTLFAMLTFFILFAFLQFLIPGGAFNT